MAKAEQERQLTAAEQRRLEKLNSVTERLTADGYKRTDLTIDLVKANLVLTLVSIPLYAVGVVLYFVLCGDKGRDIFGTKDVLIFFVAYFLLIIIHELIHGLTWSLYSPNHWKDIEFGFILKTLTPYCTCGEPLKKSEYILGALMPLIALGIIPTVIAYVIGSFTLLLIGITMIVSAGGDIMLVLKLLRFKSGTDDYLVYDHPTEAGSVIFTR